MRKYFALGALALMALSTWSATPVLGAVWKSVDLPIRTRALAYAAPGNRDSSKASMGAAATIDTSVTFAPEDWDLGVAVADSNHYIGVQLITDNAMTTGESLLVSLEGSAGQDNDATGNWSTTYFCTPATSFGGGFVAAAVITGTNRGGLLLFSGAACGANAATTAGGVIQGLEGPKVIYGGWFGYPVLRVKVLLDTVVAQVANNYRIRMWYWAVR